MRFEYEKLNENYSIFMKLGGGMNMQIEWVKQCKITAPFWRK